MGSCAAAMRTIQTLTINGGCNVHVGKAKDHAHESGHAGEGVNLHNDEINPSAQHGSETKVKQEVKHRSLQTHIVYR